MGNADSIPVVSQVKSTVQMATGDVEGGKKTMDNFQRNFLYECPVVSQVTAACQIATGDVRGGMETGQRGVKVIDDAVNSIPVVGHAKGLIHNAIGNNEAGNNAMKSATKTTEEIVGGVGRCFFGGPFGITAVKKTDVSEKLCSNFQSDFGEDNSLFGHFSYLVHDGEAELRQLLDPVQKPRIIVKWNNNSQGLQLILKEHRKEFENVGVHFTGDDGENQECLFNFLYKNMITTNLVGPYYKGDCAGKINFKWRLTSGAFLITCFSCQLYELPESNFNLRELITAYITLE